MSTKIRLARGGAKKRPYYRIVVADSRAPRDGRYIERIGSYNPMLAKDDEKRVVLQKDRIEYWLSKGAQPSKKVVTFLNAENIGQDNKVVKLLNARQAARVELKREEIEAKKKAEAEKKAAEEAEAKAKAEVEAAEAKAAEKASADSEEKPEEAPKEEAKPEENKKAEESEEKAESESVEEEKKE